MNILLIYYTGTYNTKYITELIKKRMSQNNNIDTFEINPSKIESIDLFKYDCIGIGAPIYGFNTPLPMLKFLRKQKFNKEAKYFFYKNSGETYSANDASSMTALKILKKHHCKVTNEYHFIMPYNIHFRFEDNLIKEMLEMNDKLVEILNYEITNNISNIKKYKFIDKFITTVVKLQFIGGPINSYFYKIDKTKCSNCNLCINSCPIHNIYRNKKGQIKFHHNCIMCMRCSFYCPKNAIKIGLFDNWRVNGRYDYKRIKEITNPQRIITKETKGFFKCYIKTYNEIESRYLLISDKK